MNTPFLVGKKIYMRSLLEEDINGNYISWLNDDETCRFNSHHVFPYNLEKASKYIKNLQISNSEIVLAIIDKKTDKHIGNISLQKIDFFNRNAEIAFLIGDKNYRRTGIGYEAALLLLKHGFESLGLHRIYCGTFSTNIGMQKLADKLNMKEEGRRKEAAFKKGEFIDIIEYGILKSDFLKTM